MLIRVFKGIARVLGLTVGGSSSYVKLSYAATFVERVLFGVLVWTRIGGEKLESVVYLKWVIVWTQAAVWCAHHENKQMGLQGCGHRAVLLLLVRMSVTRDPCCHIPYWDVTRVKTVQIFLWVFTHVHLWKWYRYTQGVRRERPIEEGKNPSILFIQMLINILKDYEQKYFRYNYRDICLKPEETKKIFLVQLKVSY